MRLLQIVLSLGIMIASQQLVAGKVGDIQVADTITLDDSGTTLVLNGAGIRKKFFLDIYAGALYLPARNADIDSILADSGPAAIDMHFIHSEVSREKIVAGWEDGLQANLGAEELAALRPRLDRFNAMFRTVHKGDTIRIAYLPGKGTEVRINNEAAGAVEGNDFFRALLKIWLGPKPVTKSLRDELLGNN